ncbi:MAG: hypothetical protein WKF41_02895 [Gaiellaceae bacterium]
MLGESHGIAETANALLSLVRRLDIRSLALEWSYDEVGDVVQSVFDSGRIDLDALWEVPLGGDLFASDGRFTAGHIAAIEELVRTGELEQLILFDRLDGGGPSQVERDEAMASHLLAGLQPECPTLAVAGAYHVVREPNDGSESMATRVKRVLPNLGNGALEFSSGSCHFKIDQPVEPLDRPFDAIFRLGPATPATVPSRRT